MPSARLIETVGPLAGASVIVTRPAETAAALRRRIRTLGGIALGLPGFALRASGEPKSAKAGLVAVRDANIVIFVSPAAVRFAYALHPRLRFARGTLVCAVGAATARSLRRRGVRYVLFPPQHQRRPRGDPRRGAACGRRG